MRTILRLTCTRTSYSGSSSASPLSSFLTFPFAQQLHQHSLRRLDPPGALSFPLARRISSVPCCPLLIVRLPAHYRTLDGLIHFLAPMNILELRILACTLRDWTKGPGEGETSEKGTNQVAWACSLPLSFPQLPYSIQLAQAGRKLRQQGSGSLEPGQAPS